jgi:hypothetical protein
MLAISMISTACASGPEASMPMIRTQIIARAVPEAAKVPCDKPVMLKTGSRRELKSALARDGVALLACEARRQAALQGGE